MTDSTTANRECVCADQPGGCDPWCVACAGSAACRALTIVVNPEAIGDPTQTPVVRVGIGLRALLRPHSCGGVNGFHAEGCPATDGDGR